MPPTSSLKVRMGRVRSTPSPLRSRHPEPGLAPQPRLAGTQPAEGTVTPAAVWAQVPTGSMLQLIFSALTIIVLVGRVFDHVLVGFRIPLMICLAALIVAFVGGGVTMLKTRVGLPLVLLIGWMAICVPTSIWKGGSFQTFEYFAFFALVFIPTAMGPRSMRDMRWILFLVTLCCAAQLLLVQVNGADEERLSGEVGAFANAEDLGLISCFALPLILFVASSCNVVVGTLLRIGGALFLIRTMALTGSRAAIVTLACIVLVYFLRSKGPNRIAVLVLFAVGTVLMLATIPEAMQNRLGTVFSAFTNRGGNSGDEAADSARSRRQLLEDSIRITISHPIFGVGPGQFAEYRWQEGVESGLRKGYLVTHNAYTQISSENGIPGLIFFLLFLFNIHKTIREVRRLGGGDPEAKARLALANFLELSLVAIAVSAFFMAIASYFFWYLLGGLALALERIARHDISRFQLATPGASVPSSNRIQTPSPHYTRPSLG